MSRKVLFVVNPISGTSDKNQILEYIEQTLNKDDIDWEIAKTQYAGHAIELTKDAAAKGYDTVVAIGGDGTVNEVARSLIHTNTSLGIIPCGSGNGLARHLEISQDYKRAVDIIQNGLVHTIDYGLVNNLPFFCTWKKRFVDLFGEYFSRRFAL